MSKITVIFAVISLFEAAFGQFGGHLGGFGMGCQAQAGGITSLSANPAAYGHFGGFGGFCPAQAGGLSTLGANSVAYGHYGGIGCPRSSRGLSTVGAGCQFFSGGHSTLGAGCPALAGGLSTLGGAYPGRVVMSCTPYTACTTRTCARPVTVCRQAWQTYPCTSCSTGVSCTPTCH